jgi:hypothetical protein
MSMPVLDPAVVAEAKAAIVVGQTAYLSAVQKILEIQRQIALVESATPAGRLVLGGSAEVKALRDALAEAWRERDRAAAASEAARATYHRL